MAEEEKRNPFEGIDLNSFDEASAFLLERQNIENLEHQEDEKLKQVNEKKNDEIVNEDEEIDPVTGLPKEKENKEESEEDNEDTSSSDDITKDSSRLTPYFKLLMEEGVFSSEDYDKWDGTTEGMLNLKHEKDVSQWEQFKQESLDPRTKWLQDNLEAGVPFEKLLQMDKETLALEQLTDEALTDNIDLQKQVAKMYYGKTTRFSEDTINKAIKRLEDSGELEAEVKSFTKELGTINEQEKQLAMQQAAEQRAAAERAEQEMLQNLKKTVNETKEVIPGMRVTDIMKDRIYKTLTTVTSQDEQGNMLNKITEARSKDPIAFEIKLAYLFEATNGFSDFSSLTKGVKKQAYKDFEVAAGEIDKTKQSPTRSNNFRQDEFMNEIDDLYKKGFFGGR